MQSYRIEKKITSTSVSLDLLNEIETYLIEQGENQKVDASRIRYDAIIYDKYGEEKIPLFNEYPRSTLPNEVERVSLEIHDYETSFNIEVSFDSKKLFSRLRVSIKGINAKETVNGISSTIQQHVNEHKNLNYLFYGQAGFFSGFLTGMSFPALIGGLFFSGKYDVANYFVLFGIFGIGLSTLLDILKSISPYSEFDTLKNRHRSVVRKWVLNGLAGVFIFGLLGQVIIGQ